MLAFTSLSTFLLLSATSSLAAPIRRTAASIDITVFQFAGVLEKLESEFYKQALAKFQDSDFTAAGFGNVNIPKEEFSVIAFDESTHDSVIESTLKSFGVEPLSGCEFNFGNALDTVASMAATARVVENVGVSAYLGGANLLENKELLVAAGTILTSEARHQTVLNILNSATAIPSPFDIALTPSQVLAIAGGFISGCDLGIPANKALTITNTGTVAPGTKLTFDFDGKPTGDTSTLTCQMLTGGAAFALSLPFEECVVPSLNGPVYLFIVNGTQPLLNSQTNQANATIVAGPTLAFIDSVPETLGQAVKAASPELNSTQTISSDDAAALVGAAQGSSSTTTTSSSESIETATATDSSASSTETASATEVVAASANTSTGAAANGAVEVLGWSSTTGSAAAAATSSAAASESGSGSSSEY